MIAKYNCKCFDEQVEVDIPVRAAHTGVLFYVDKIVMKKIGEDHRRRSPKCQATSVQDVKIPISDRGVGFL